MGIAFLHGNGGGGAGLNYKVVGGTTEPTNPKVNTIWINTSAKITGHVFDVSQPTGIEGLVWIKIGTSSAVAFNALKKNTIQVYPIGAKQYVDGAWVNVAAYTYLSSGKIQWAYERRYLYKDGPITDETGDWSLKAIHANTGNTTTGIQFSAGSTLTLTGSNSSGSGQWSYGELKHAKTVKTNGATKLCISFTKFTGGTGSDGNPILAISTNKTSVADFDSSSGFVYYNTGNLTEGAHVKEIDVSGVTDINLLFYTELWGAPADSIDIAIDEMWLE